MCVNIYMGCVALANFRNFLMMHYDITTPRFQQPEPKTESDNLSKLDLIYF
jgi:hypothetical protein